MKPRLQKHESFTSCENNPTVSAMCANNVTNPKAEVLST